RGKRNEACPASGPDSLQGLLTRFAPDTLEECIHAARRRREHRLGPAGLVVVEDFLRAETAYIVDVAAARHAEDPRPYRRCNMDGHGAHTTGSPGYQDPLVSLQ